MAQTDRQARNQHIHRGMGPRRSVAMTFGISVATLSTSLGILRSKQCELHDFLCLTASVAHDEVT